jgi:fumarate hydratase class II
MYDPPGALREETGVDTRTETDSLGSIQVPADRYWGAQTQRALEHFGIGRERMPVALVRAYGLLKQAAAEVNGSLGELPRDIADLVARTAREVRDGSLDDHFPLGIWQSGSGTQTHMNVNEVIACRANELAGRPRGAKQPVHPNDHVNRGQSTNDTFPTAMHVSASLALARELLPSLDRLATTLDDKAARFAHLIKIGRTHLQDATPLTLGQEIGGWAAQLRLSMEALRATQPRLHQLAIGGTAVGTGLNAHPRFGGEVAAALARETDLPFASAGNRFAALAGHEAMAELSGGLGTLAGSLVKIANDVRWLASGPRCGLGEIRIPENEPGSSIMPGKANPTQAEALVMVCLQVMGNQTTVVFAAGQGNFELNVCKPLIAHAVLQSVSLLARACDAFDAHCARGIEAHEDAIAAAVERSLMLVTALTPHIGYDAAARIARKAHAENLSLREAALAEGIVAAADYDRWVRPEAMLGPRKQDPGT